MSEELVTVRTFRFLPEADACRALLESEGVTAFVIDAEIVQTDWFLGNAVGYIKVQVPESQVPRALELLELVPERGAHNVDDATLDDTRCLACGKPMTEGDTACPDCGWSYAAGETEERLN